MTPVTHVADVVQDDSVFRERTRRLCIYLPAKRLDKIRFFMDVFTLLHNDLMSTRDWGSSIRVELILTAPSFNTLIRNRRFFSTQCQSAKSSPEKWSRPQ